jgi:hypothetical protein
MEGYCTCIMVTDAGVGGVGEEQNDIVLHPWYYCSNYRRFTVFTTVET